jgi:hypothetical protein
VSKAHEWESDPVDRVSRAKLEQAAVQMPRGDSKDAVGLTMKVGGSASDPKQPL